MKNKRMGKKIKRKKWISPNLKILSYNMTKSGSEVNTPNEDATYEFSTQSP